MSASTSGSTPRRVDRATWLVAGTVTVGGIMSSIDTTIVNVALDTLGHDFRLRSRACSGS